MEKIWDLFIDKKLTGSTLIKNAYSDLHKLHLNWLVDPKGMTIQQWVDVCCEQLQNKGYNLEETPVDIVKIEFIKYDIGYEVPKQYTHLSETKNTFEKRYSEMLNWGAPAEMLQEMKKTIDIIESGIKALL